MNKKELITSLETIAFNVEELEGQQVSNLVREIREIRNTIDQLTQDIEDDGVVEDDKDTD